MGGEGGEGIEEEPRYLSEWLTERVTQEGRRLREHDDSPGGLCGSRPVGTRTRTEPRREAWMENPDWESPNTTEMVTKLPGQTRLPKSLLGEGTEASLDPSH